MGLFEIITILIVLSALLSYVNHRFIGLPTTIGVMVIALGMSMVLVGLGHLGWDIRPQAEAMLEEIDFSKALMKSEEES